MNFQQRVFLWMSEAFRGQGGKDMHTRLCRFFEEASELVQSLGLPREQAHELVDYVYNRPEGEPFQESGGVSLTHAALCTQVGIDMHEAREAELRRVWQPEVMRKIAAKQKHKPPGPLPE